MQRGNDTIFERPQEHRMSIGSVWTLSHICVDANYTVGDLMSVGTYVCPACKQFFKTKEELEAHAKTAH